MLHNSLQQAGLLLRRGNLDSTGTDVMEKGEQENSDSDVKLE